MNKLVFAVVVVALCCENSEAADKFGKELVQNFGTCSSRLPVSITGDDLKWVSETTGWYLKSTDEIFFSRLSDIFLTGSENVPVNQVRGFFDSPCITDNNAVYMTGQAVTEQYKSGALGVTLSVSSTLQESGLVTSVFNLPNSQTPALTVNWLGVLTDRRTYVLYMSCLPEGHLGYQVFATVPELDAFSKHQITSYLEHAGFPDNLSGVTTYRASTCTNQR